jgi:hypothetical protein
MPRRRCTAFRVSPPVTSAPSDGVGWRAGGLAAADARKQAPPDDFATRDT